mmetsp:Transcript_23565/g.50126  ORF Transcript_23565/g.50126 Transcript_23565/m.50126 type:complete len:209 (+) Transcript_23565:247-873(+)
MRHVVVGESVFVRLRPVPGRRNLRGIPRSEERGRHAVRHGGFLRNPGSERAGRNLARYLRTAVFRGTGNIRQRRRQRRQIIGAVVEFRGKFVAKQQLPTPTSCDETRTLPVASDSWQHCAFRRRFASTVRTTQAFDRTIALVYRKLPTFSGTGPARGYLRCLRQGFVRCRRCIELWTKTIVFSGGKIPGTRGSLGNRTGSVFSDDLQR